MFLKKSLLLFSFLVTVSTATYAALPVDSTLLAHWSFESSGVDFIFNDHSPYHHELVVTEGLNNGSLHRGPFGNYCSITNNGAEMMVRNSSQNTFNTDQFSIMAYVKVPAGTNNSKTIFQSSQCIVDKSGFIFAITGDLRLSLSFASGDSWSTITTDPLVKVDTLNHVAVSSDGHNVNFYHNGLLVRTISSAGVYTKGGGEAIVGSQLHQGIAYFGFSGDIDEVRVYKRALPDYEILSILNSKTDNDGDGYTLEEGDYNDYDSSVNPGAIEIMDSIDNDCNRLIDDGLVPVILTQPLSQRTFTQSSVSFSITAMGYRYTLQWKKNGIPIPGATSLVYTINAVTMTDTGTYTVEVSNATGSVESNAAVLTCNNSHVTKISTGVSCTYILRSDSTLWACGWNSNGKLGDSSSTDRLIPKLIMTGVIEADGGNNHSVFLKADGSLWSCGNNSYGQLGDGTLAGKMQPMQIMSDVRTIAAGFDFTLAVKNDGSMWAWGRNTYGQLGNTTTSNLVIPTQITDSVNDVDAGGEHTLILKNNGTLWACGRNSSGQIGTNNVTNYSTPVQILTDVQLIAAGDYHSFVRKTDNTIWGWGENEQGQIGVNVTRTDILLPRQLTSLPNNVQVISAGSTHTLFLLGDGRIAGCGDNNQGQLIHSSRRYFRSVDIMTTGAKAIAAGDLFTVFQKTDNSVWACGINSHGQLGDGTTVNRAIVEINKYQL